MLEDVKDVFKFITTVLAQPIGESKVTVDPSRLAVGGESFGSFTAYLAGVHVTPKPKAVVGLYGMGIQLLHPFYLLGRSKDVKQFIMPFGAPLWPIPSPELEELFSATEVCTGTAAGHDERGQGLHPRQEMFAFTLQMGNYLDWHTGTSGFSARLKKGYDDSTGLLSEEVIADIDEKTRQIFPELLLDSSFPPTFLIHGDNDSAVLLEQSQHAAKLLSGLGVENKLVVYPGGVHGFDGGAKAVDGDEIFEKIKGVEVFLQKHLS
jgi:acetyl esterase/lipase